MDLQNEARCFAFGRKTAMTSLKNTPSVLRKLNTLVQDASTLHEVDSSLVENHQSLPWYRRTFFLAMTSGILLWASFPPLNLWPLAWIALLGLTLLIQNKTLSSKRAYRVIWIAGFVHWLLILQFLRLPHWTGYFGWVAVSLYLACYFPLFVCLARVAVHRLHISPIIAAPVVWVGLELGRGYLFTGFSFALLGHTQVAWTSLIQISDIAGAYGVSSHAESAIAEC